MSVSSVAQSEDLLTEILLRLPPKPLTTFKCVSKQWRAFISNPHFVRTYLTSHRFPSSLLYEFPQHPNNTLSLNIIPLTLPPSDSSPLTLLLRRLFVNAPNLHLRVWQSCNGLLLVRGIEVETHTGDGILHYFVFNPITKRLVAFEPIVDAFDKTVFASGLHFSSLFLAYDPLRFPHFRVVSLQSVSYDDACDTFDLGRTEFNSSAPYYTYKLTVYSSETGCWSDGICFNTTAMIKIEAGVYCNGAIHWHHPTQKSLYFDVASQCLKTYPMPPEIRSLGPGQFLGYFGQSRGHLHMVFLSSAQLLLFDVFELVKDYSGWSVRIRVDLSHSLQVAIPGINLETFLFNIMCIVRQEKEEDSVVVLYIDDYVLSYNLVDKTLREITEFQSIFELNATEMPLENFELFEYCENLSWVEGFTA
ncbi:F-box protein [Spatholobus suberectus]|nr:F-box protein [Spatholobus suberectus]